MSAIGYRHAVPADRAALESLLRIAYGTERASVRIPAPGDDATSVILATAGERLVGTATLHDYRSGGYIAQVGVDPEFRRRGIARQLTAMLLDDAGRRGLDWLELDATAEGAPLYRIFGFVAGGETIAFEGPTFGARAGAAVAAGLADRADILAFDRAAFGADRSATLAARLADPALPCFVVRSDGELRGYALARGDRAAPWLAADAATAADLLDAVRARLAPATIAVYVPGSNAAARAALERRGFVAAHVCTHMQRGAPAPALRDRIYGRLSLGEG